MKDNFSHHAQDYARYRPVYPEALYRYLFSLIPEKNLAWDCGTGNWFDFEKFYKNVKQALKPDGIIAVIGYSVFKTEDDLNNVIQYFYKDITEAYWDPERRYLDEDYLTIPFPFEEEVTPSFNIKVKWTKEHFYNYLNTWSAVKHYEKKEGMSPLNLIKEKVNENWGKNTEKEFIFPILLRVGKN